MAILLDLPMPYNVNSWADSSTFKSEPLVLSEWSEAKFEIFDFTHDVKYRENAQ